MEEALKEAGVPEVEVNTQSWRGVDKSIDHSEQAAHSGNRTEIREALDQDVPTSGRPESEETEQVHRPPNKVELLSDHRQSCEYFE